VRAQVANEVTNLVANEVAMTDLDTSVLVDKMTEGGWEYTGHKRLAFPMLDGALHNDHSDAFRRYRLPRKFKGIVLAWTEAGLDFRDERGALGHKDRMFAEIDSQVRGRRYIVVYDEEMLRLLLARRYVVSGLFDNGRFVGLSQFAVVAMGRFGGEPVDRVYAVDLRFNAPTLV
jgi:hypothetical protein